MNRRSIQLSFVFSAMMAPFLARIAPAQSPLKFEVATVKLGDSGKLPNGMVRPQSITGGIGSSNPDRFPTGENGSPI